MFRRAVTDAIDGVLGWRSRFSGAVRVGRGSTIAWRRIRRAAGNDLSVGEGSIVHADINFEETGGRIQIGSRTFIGRSNLVCYRSLTIGDDVIMSWGITIVDHDSHSIDWMDRRNDVREWAARRKNWDKIANAPVVISDRAWIGFNVSILKGVSIGTGAVIGACSVVTRDIPPYSLAVGNPARVIRLLGQPSDENREP
ncbi:acetyltransferase-like isoleucine patch superfamily enzyme [Bradyrhizobium japonicum]|uniref:acyltransferase n=1 Tax=Bradyrhizobium elkanii TaxID=29448 RepID=UPI00036B7BEF|nr:acyltransferase [Bradyrhizobium elkanii]MCP1732618.1 galactoside O-acetyltransferase [Bradyrhizobium elkanii]MCS3567956.1 galactoside O-acetyltransferase [Bradyrhizobium elkanii]MCS3590561.1 galactoside O-acetyltransferase [Bradyrhizobium elkanii]MCS3620004.1 galactoside O-acetyltransferase [Bradyrhizobium elkanii]MCW2111742.1 galactoside O-acetyltransferase [Bradyrhizobium elkanii]